MKRELIISHIALNDMNSISSYLHFKIKVPLTAEKFLNDFILLFIDIANHSEAYPKNQLCLYYQASPNLFYLDLM